MVLPHYTATFSFQLSIARRKFELVLKTFVSGGQGRLLLHFRERGKKRIKPSPEPAQILHTSVEIQVTLLAVNRQHH